MSEKIITPPSTSAYREGWDRVFGQHDSFEATRKAYPDIPFTREQFDHATEVKNILLGKEDDSQKGKCTIFSNIKGERISIPDAMFLPENHPGW